MNPGICYLYEYKNNQKLRNVGFMKVTPNYRSCILQINVRGVPVKNQDFVSLLTFYEKDSAIIAKPVDNLPCRDKSIYARLSVDNSVFPDGRTLADMSGFLLQTESGQYYAAFTDNLTFNTANIRPWETAPEPVMEAESLGGCPCILQNEEKPEVTSVENASGQEDCPVIVHSPAQESAPQPEQFPVPEYMPENAPLPESILIPEPEPQTGNIQTGDVQTEEPQTGDTQTEKLQTEDMQTREPQTRDMQTRELQTGELQTEEPQTGDTQTEEPRPRETVHKIQRSDLSMLPRRCWNLANNSFLLHGYHNYHHLLLVEEDGHFWLGVPGIYAPREARAAEIFGFPQFTQTYTAQLDLDSDEWEDNEKFGYWCRFIC